MSRQDPLTRVHSVSILGPSGKSPYFRLTWTRADGSRGHTTGGRTLESAVAKAEAVHQHETRAAGPGAEWSLGAIRDEYVSSPEGRNQRGEEQWKPSQLAQVTEKLARMLRGLEDAVAADVDRALIDRMRAQAGTPTTVKQNTSVLRGFLRWGAANGYFTPEQAALLPPNAVAVAPALKGRSAPSRRSSTRSAGAAREYVAVEDAPSREQLTRLGEEMEALAPGWGRLAVEMAAQCGPRWSEQFALTAYDVVDGNGGRPAHLRIHWQINPKATRKNGQPALVRPKGNKTRVTGLSETSWTGYALRQNALRRREEALQEQAAGTNPDALMFPTVRGKRYHATSFHEDLFKPAAIAAGWPHEQWEGVKAVWNEAEKRYTDVTFDGVLFRLTWHSLRHRFARVCIDVLRLPAAELMVVGGWENLRTVENRYYRSGAEHVDRALAAMA